MAWGAVTGTQAERQATERRRVDLAKQEVAWKFMKFIARAEGATIMVKAQAT
jgi:hypothetical protein